MPPPARLRARLAAALPAAALLLCAPSAAPAVEVSGNAWVYGGTSRSENGGRQETDLLNQVYTLSLSQPLTPYLRLQLSYNDNQFDTTSDSGEFNRGSREPSIQLSYRRPRLTALALFQDRRNESSIPGQDLDIRSFQTQVSYRPDRGPSYALRLRDESNVADVAAFGRNVDTRTVDLDVFYSRDSWSTTYRFQTYDLDNTSTGLSLDQDRHEVRFLYDDRVWNDRLNLHLDSWVIWTRQEEVVPTGVALADPLPIREGLFLVDTTPGVGELLAAPDLVDGDITTAARESAAAGAPFIEIGGANTDRNIGVDLGFIRPVTQLEITVTSPSDPGLQWAVYRSPDNLAWDPVPGAASGFDPILLRYTLTFPETSARYFKAVNLTVNSQASVAVSEIRALVTIGTLNGGGRNTTIYRTSADARMEIADGVAGTLGISFNNDRNLASGLARREFRELSYRAGLEIAMTPRTDVLLGYRTTDFRQDSRPVLDRREDLYSATVRWVPLETLDTAFVLSRRTETDRGRLLRSADTAQARAFAQLLPDLRLVSEVVVQSIDDPFSGFTQESLRIQGGLETQLFPQWSLTATAAQTWYDFSARVPLTRRTTAELGTSWRITPFVTTQASWTYRQDDLTDNLSQRYNIIWSPGGKLSTSLQYQEFDSDIGNMTTNSGLSFNYRVNTRMTLFASLSRSTTESTVVGRTEVTNGTFGLNVVF